MAITVAISSAAKVVLFVYVKNLAAGNSSTKVCIAHRPHKALVGRAGSLALAPQFYPLHLVVFWEG